jgi:uncharacterized membrane protein
VISAALRPRQDLVAERRDAALNSLLHPTQRRLVIALAITLLCLPLLVLDLMGGHGGTSSDVSAVDTEVPEPSMVVAVSPSEAPSTTAPSTTVTTEAPAATATTAAPKAPTTTAPKAAAKPQATTTTTAPKVAAPAPPPAGPVPSGSEASFLACVRQRESHGDYTAVDPSGTFMGAYQIYQGGWDAVARSIGRSDLVGVRPNRAAPADQDTIALAMLRQYGRAPWGGACG